MQRLLFVAVLAASLLLASCGGGRNPSSSTTPVAPGGPATLSSITISPASATIAQGTTQAFTATGNYSDGSTKDLTATAQWACLLPNMATVSSNSPTQGLATGILPGTVVISASSGSFSNSAQLTITGATIASLAVTPSGTTTIGFENQQQYKATATFSDMSTQDVTNLANWTIPSGPFISAYSGLAIGTSVGTMFELARLEIIRRF